MKKISVLIAAFFISINILAQDAHITYINEVDMDTEESLAVAQVQILAVLCNKFQKECDEFPKILDIVQQSSDFISETYFYDYRLTDNGFQIYALSTFDRRVFWIDQSMTMRLNGGDGPLVHFKNEEN
ncbi:MAG: hypothetical protein GY858_09615 [Candidatus Omnitrophica bacterium]|nr:hypothetical protein [Candidatus Omnitrophota bacterium]